LAVFSVSSRRARICRRTAISCGRPEAADFAFRLCSAPWRTSRLESALRAKRLSAAVTDKQVVDMARLVHDAINDMD
jgi:hypothetical protein